ncbi:MAG: FliH/SctL family protein [Solirubrobacteraceae bacterium]
MSETAVSYDFEQLEPSTPPAREEPAQIVAQAVAEADRLRSEAHAAGYAEGRVAGHEEGAAEVTRLARTFEEAVTGIEALRGEVVEAIERDALDLGLQLAAKVAAGVAGVAELRGELISEAVRGALARVSERRRIAVLVNPADLDLVKGAIAEQTAASGVEHCEVRSDERVAAGGAIVATEEGEVDASVWTLLERAREVVEASLASERAA